MQHWMENYFEHPPMAKRTGASLDSLYKGGNYVVIHVAANFSTAQSLRVKDCLAK